MVEIERGQPKTKQLLFYGRVDQLTFDLDRIMWHDELSFMSYTTKECRAILQRHQQIPNLSLKWTGILPAHHYFRWTTMWTRDRTKKEAGLIWLTWNRAVAVNDWRDRIDGTINRNCSVCDTGARESVLHRYWECPQAQKAWLWATHVLNKLTLTTPAGAWRGPWRSFHWKQALFSQRIPRRF